MRHSIEKIVQNGEIPLAPGMGTALQKESPLEKAQPGRQISGEVVAPAAQSSQGTPLFMTPAGLRELFPGKRCLLLCKADFLLIR